MPTGMAEDFDSQDVRVIGVDCKFLVYLVLRPRFKKRKIKFLEKFYDNFF